MLASARILFMSAKLLLKTVFLIIVLLFLVLMGMENRGTVEFALKPVLPNKVILPSALMYFAFFAVGVLTGTILTAGGGKSGGGGSSGKSGK